MSASFQFCGGLILGGKALGKYTTVRDSILFPTAQQVGLYISKSVIRGHVSKRVTLDYAVSKVRNPIRFTFSQHTKTGLVAIPITIDQLKTFNPKVDAHPETVLQNKAEYMKRTEAFLKPKFSGTLKVKKEYREVGKSGPKEKFIGRDTISVTTMGSKPLRINIKGHPDQLLADKWKKSRGWDDKSYEDSLEYYKGKKAVITVKADGELVLVHYSKKGVRVDGKSYQCILANHHASVYAKNPITEYFSQVCKSKDLKEVIALGEIFTLDTDGSQLPFPNTLSVVKTGSHSDWVKEVRLWLFDIHSIDGKLFKGSYAKRLAKLKELFGGGEVKETRDNPPLESEEGEKAPIFIPKDATKAEIMTALQKGLLSIDAQKARVSKWIFDPSRKLPIPKENSKEVLEFAREQIHRVSRNLLRSGGTKGKKLEGFRLAQDYPFDVYMRRIYVRPIMRKPPSGKVKEEQIEDYEVPMPSHVLKLYVKVYHKLFKIPYKPPAGCGVVDKDGAQDRLLRRHTKRWLQHRRIPFPKWFAERIMGMLLAMTPKQRNRYNFGDTLRLKRIARNEYIVVRPDEKVPEMEVR